MVEDELISIVVELKRRKAFKDAVLAAIAERYMFEKGHTVRPGELWMWICERMELRCNTYLCRSFLGIVQEQGAEMIRKDGYKHIRNMRKLGENER